MLKTAPKPQKVKKIKEPTAAEMQKFCQKYKSKWSKLCENRPFMDAVTINLKLAGEIAEKIK